MKRQSHAAAPSNQRRKLLATFALGGGTLATAPERWSKPIIESVLLPAHAETTPGEATPGEPTPQECIEGFSSEFAPSNWSFDADGGDGSVETNAPTSIELIGSDAIGTCSPSNFGNATSFCITIPGSLPGGTISFDWSYETTDELGPGVDPFGYRINGSFTQLTNDDGPDSQSSSNAVSVQPGDVFCFVVRSDDECAGEASAVLTNFRYCPD